MREWEIYVLSALYEKVLQWGGDLDTFALFLATAKIRLNPEIGGPGGLPELNLQAYASREKLQEILHSGTSLSEHRTQCMVTLQREHFARPKSISFPPEHLSGLIAPQHGRRASHAEDETMAGYYAEVEDANREVFEKLWCFPTDLGFNGMHFVAIRVSLQQYREVVDLLTDIYGVSEQGIRTDIIGPDDADGIHRSLMNIYNRRCMQKRRSRSS